jgi:hypothetical protein
LPRPEVERPRLDAALLRLEVDRPRLDAALLLVPLDFAREEPALLRDAVALPRAELPPRLEARPRAEALPRVEALPREVALPPLEALLRLVALPRPELALLPDEVVFRRLEPDVPRAASARLRTALPACVAALPACLAPLAAVVAASRTPFALVAALLAADSALFAAVPAVRRAWRRLFCASFTCRVAAAFLPRAEAVLLLRVRVVCLRCRVAAAFFPADLRLALDRDFACAMVSRLPCRFRARRTPSLRVPQRAATQTAQSMLPVIIDAA